jgi:hypothetical protein
VVVTCCCLIHSPPPPVPLPQIEDYSTGDGISDGSVTESGHTDYESGSETEASQSSALEID